MRPLFRVREGLEPGEAALVRLVMRSPVLPRRLITRRGEGVWFEETLRSPVLPRRLITRRGEAIWFGETLTTREELRGVLPEFSDRSSSQRLFCLPCEEE